LSADIEEQRSHNREGAEDSERTHQAFQQMQDKLDDCTTSIKQEKTKMEGFTTTLKGHH
jgi:hypothetical protein